MTDSILIIESDDNLRAELVSAFAKAGFATTAVPGYSTELLKPNEFKTDLVIMDAVLPSIDGREAYQQIGSTLGVPVVLLGGDQSDEAWGKAIQGADIVLYEIKPFSYRILVAKVKAILRRRKIRRAIDL